MLIKKFVPCIYLFNTHAVANLNDRTIVETDPLRLVEKYCTDHADEIIVFDMSEGEGDEAHDAALDTIREIVLKSEIPVLVGGNINRLEDIKKILYTGCKGCILDWEKESNRKMAKDGADRFGREKLFISFADPEVLEDTAAMVKECASGIVLLNTHKIRETAEKTDLPVCVQINDIALNKFLEIFAYENICGITGNTINGSSSEILSLKRLCIENDIPVSTLEPQIKWDELKTDANGLIPVIVQDHITGDVLMLAYMNEKAYEDTLMTGMMHYYSRSRQEQWLKGETSGHYQYVKKICADCDKDTLLAFVSQVGVACHTGAMSCFFNEIATVDGYDEAAASKKRSQGDDFSILSKDFATILERKAHPKEGSYTNYLFDKGIDKILKKVGEEATEMVIAAKNPNPNEIKYEISDFLYHMMVLMAEKGITWKDITEELENRD